MSTMNKIVSTVGLIAILAIFSSYTFGILSTNQENINVTGTEYEQQYKASSRVQAVTAELFSPIALILGVLMLVGVLAAFRKTGRRRRW